MCYILCIAIISTRLTKDCSIIDYYYSRFQVLRLPIDSVRTTPIDILQRRRGFLETWENMVNRPEFIRLCVPAQIAQVFLVGPVYSNIA